MQNRNPTRHSMRGPVLWLVVLMIHGASATGLTAQTVSAADTAAIAGDSRPNPNKPNPNKPCVLLRNGNVLFGSATKIGDRVSITRDDGSTISLAGDQVEAIGGSLIELYEHRKSNRFQGDLNRYQADVRWCLRNGLVRQAAADILHARSLAPSDPQTIQLLGLVATRMKEDSTPARGPAVGPAAGRPAESVRPVSYETTETIGVFDQPLNHVRSDRSQHSDAKPNLAGADRDAATPALVSSLPNEVSGGIQVSEATAHDFATRVQPILLNRCVRCHHKDVDDARGFTLRSSQELKWAPTIVSDENLRSVLKHVNLNDPLTSVIRERAIDGHGGRRNTFGSSGSAMLGNLDRWLSSLQASRVATPWEAAMDQHVAEDSSLEQGVPPELVSVGDGDPALRDMIPEPPRPRGIDAGESSAGESSAGRNGPRKMRRMPKVENPFDPELFNRRFHGG